VAGSEALKISTPMKPLINPSVAFVMPRPIIVGDGLSAMSIDCARAFSTKVDTGLVKENATNKGLERFPEIQIKWKAL
jgi:hypothetical protein